MKSAIRYLLFVFLAVMITGCMNDYSSKPVCRVENGRIIFKLDKRWSDQEMKEILSQYDLDSSLVAKAYSGKGEVMIDSILWKYRTVNPFFAELSKPLDKRSGDFLQKNEVLIINDSWIRKPLFVESAPVVSGLNSFRRRGAFKYENEVAQFFLPNYKDASNIYLSGTFNDWSTMQSPMTACDSGWILRISLKPGKYLYRYIVDGKWGTDPNNELQERDDERRNNSVVFCYNHRFALKDKTEAKKVIVTGNFTNWSRDKFPMERNSNGWSLDLYLQEGTYAYKFIADGKWLADPANTDNRKDANGNLNSFFSIGELFTFRLSDYLSATKIILAGSFNKWRQDELVMTRDNTGWQLPLALAPGNYEYKFIVDGDWITDPANPYKTGSGDYTNSFMAFKPNHTFVLENYSDAANVNLAGSFNGWSADSYRMVKKDGKWTISLYLKPGKYTYKFIVDRKWILDPGNEIYEANEYGTNNSVLWIEQ